MPSSVWSAARACANLRPLDVSSQTADHNKKKLNLSKRRPWSVLYPGRNTTLCCSPMPFSSFCRCLPTTRIVVLSRFPSCSKHFTERVSSQKSINGTSHRAAQGSYESSGGSSPAELTPFKHNDRIPVPKGYINGIHMPCRRDKQAVHASLVLPHLWTGLSTVTVATKV